RQAIDETARRRRAQEQHNRAHGITPTGIRKAIRDLGQRLKQVAESRAGYEAGQPIPKEEVAKLIKDLERQMKEAARAMEFERAALLRDQIYELRATMSDTDTPDTVLAVEAAAARRGRGAGGNGDTSHLLTEEASAARAARASRSPSRYGGRRRR
ncbi:MAG TPA: UvrB/UvrC motif-containing protein, partial [Chloroflexota bacterium]|nr:UvrB/UvrC motif-containing protein [Chloroflexota bacterium]